MTTRALLYVAPLCVALFACQPHASPPPDLVRAASVDAAQPVDAARPPVVDAADPYALKWTAPAVVERLAKRCSFDPDKLPVPERSRLYGVDPTLYAETGPGDDGPALACGANIFDQSCSYDPCFEEGEEKCKPRCVKGCDACAQGCVATCTPCEAMCTDDACRHACAVATATCRQSCLTSRDHCVTGTCAATYKVCSAKRKVVLTAKGYDKACARLQTCSEACRAASDNKCYDACTAAEKRRVPAFNEEECGAFDAP